MPKIPKQEEFEDVEDEKDEDEDELEVEDYDDYDTPQPVAPVRKETRGRKPKPKEVKRRFGIVPPQPLRYVDIETNEVIAEADLKDTSSMLVAILASISDLKEQIERIEVQIGAIG